MSAEQHKVCLGASRWGTESEGQAVCPVGTHERGGMKGTTFFV